MTIESSEDDNKCEVRQQPGWQPGDGAVKIFVQFETFDGKECSSSYMNST